MGRMLRWISYGAAGLVIFVVCAALGGYAASVAMIRWPQAKAPVHLVANHGPDAVARGARIAKIYGCHDCHGADLTGRLFFDEMPVARMSGPNLARRLAHQSDVEVARAIRTGVAADGRSLWIMPSDAFARLSDGETADLIAYLRTFPAKGEDRQVKDIGPVGRIGVLLGKFRSSPAILKREGDVEPADLGPQYAQGRNLTRACIECHGLNLKGSAVTNAPDLTVAGAYDLSDFKTLMRTGIAAGGRRLGLMTETAPARFTAFSDQEVEALHTYLRARADKGL
jgi:mono/diheme cytochrome c family protein